MTRIGRTVIDEGANHQLFEGRVWESVRLARLSQGHHKGIRVTSATTLMYSHGRGARGGARGSGGTGHRSTSGHARSTDWQNKTSPYAYPAHHPYPPLPPPPHRSLPLQSSVYAFSPTPCHHPSAISYRSPNVFHLNRPPISLLGSPT